MSDKELLMLLEELERREAEAGWTARFFKTEEERLLYPHWMEFFAASKDHKQIMALCANQVGKSTAGMCAVSMHMTGIYPDWYTGIRYDHPTNWLLCGETSKDVKTALQDRLLGIAGQFGTGFIPKECIDFQSLTDTEKADTSIGSFRVKHISGGYSVAHFKTYEQGRKSFQSYPNHCILLDEEPPIEVYTEALMRTAAGDAIMLLTFTPLKGVSDTVMNFLGEHDIQSPSGPLDHGKYLIRASWDDAPHLSPAVKEALINSMPPFQRDARTKGIPTLGSGAIYPVSEETLFIDPFKIPDYWPRCFGMDVGWKYTAVTWFALDPDTGITYLYSEFLGQEQTPQLNTISIKSRGEWIPGAIDPASRGRSQEDGDALFDTYTQLGLNIVKADNSVETWLWNILSLMQEGRLKIFNTCTSTLKEFRMYRRDEKGKVVKKDDHLMDSMRYGISTGRDIAITNEPRSQYTPGVRRWRG